MGRFTKRSYEKELLDRDDIPFEDIRRNMQELDLINHRLGGHAITLKGLHAFKEEIQSAVNKNGFVSVLEIGCGGGDNLRVIRKYFSKKNIPVQLSGVDINPHCISFAQSRSENKDIQFIASDYRNYKPALAPDLIFSSLFCHHFNDEGVKEIFSWMDANATAGYFINDLHRHPLAYYSIAFLTRLFSKSYLVKNDAPLSVLRGFKKKELQSWLPADRADIHWKWAFRWLITTRHG
jgi:SAM-dependent methyltransferase